MSSFNGLWLPQSDASNSSPGEYDMHKVVNSQLVQAARQNRTFMSRLMVNNTVMYTGDGKVNRDVEFTITGGIGTATHLKGDRFSGMNRNQIQRSITLDLRPRTTTIIEENITQMFEQVNVRGDILASMGNALASWDEVQALLALVDCAKTGAVGSENTTEFLPGGGEIQLSTATAGEAKALGILAAIEETAIKWGQMGVPMNGRHVIVSPEDYWAILNLEKTQSGSTAIAGGIYGNADIVSDKQDFSAVVNGELPLRYRGFLIWQHNMIKATYDIHTTGLQAAHTPDVNHSSRGALYNSGDLTKVQGIIFQEEAVGKADVMSIMYNQGEVPMSTDEYVNAMTWVGYGTLNPSHAVVLDVA